MINETQHRNAQLAVLHCVVCDEILSKHLIFRGAAALWLFYGGRRASPDLDFLCLSFMPTTAKQHLSAMKARLNRMLNAHLPTYAADYQNQLQWLREHIHIDLSMVDTICQCMEIRLSAESLHPLKVLTVENILAEKLVAMLTWHPREKTAREQDLYDIASTLTFSTRTLDRQKLISLAQRKAEKRGVALSAGSFNEAIRARLRQPYALLESRTGDSFIPFEKAWTELVNFAKALE